MTGKPRLQFDLPRNDIMIADGHRTTSDILNIRDYGIFWFVGNVNGRWEFWEFHEPKSFFLRSHYSVFATPELYDALAPSSTEFKLVLTWDDDDISSAYIRDNMIVTLNIARKYVTSKLTAYLMKNG